MTTHNLTSHWSLEASAQHLGTDTEFDILGLQDRDAALDAYRLNLLYNFLAGERFRPFWTAGVGSEQIDVVGFGESCDFGWNAGAGFRWFLSPNWNLRLDGRYVSISVGDEVADRQGNLEGTLGIGVLFGGQGEEVAEGEPPRENRRPTVSCKSDRAEVLPGENVVFRATASDPEGDPLTYAWSTTAGRIEGTGATATLDFSGAVPPATATVTVRVSDDHGNTASSDCAVRLGEPVRQPEAVLCLAGGFPRNLARLTNVDKACLDDVTQRLNIDPRARVIIIGHADSHESSPDAIAQQRADAVKDYLVEERGIEAARITTRSAGATRLDDTGPGASAQARNRRVEIWFVPEGATVPE